ncbi:MAG: hypothetical protein ACD_23C00830G0001 [uncultured bacterium]|nr:MAG: hypothetical protein ACD_23C00830G0001 [uncultured bacterium]
MRQDFKLGESGIGWRCHIEKHDEKQGPKNRITRLANGRRGVVANQQVGQGGGADSEAKDQRKKVDAERPLLRLVTREGFTVMNRRLAAVNRQKHSIFPTHASLLGIMGQIPPLALKDDNVLHLGITGL